MSETFGMILVPVDGSDASSRAARAGVDLARMLEIPVCLFHVFPAASADSMRLAGLLASQVDQAAQASAQKAFDKVQTDLGEAQTAGLNMETSAGDPAEEILAWLEDNPTTMVVMGRRGRGAMSKLLLGSVSDKVLRHASGPVTVVG